MHGFVTGLESLVRMMGADDQDSVWLALSDYCELQNQSFFLLCGFLGASGVLRTENGSAVLPCGTVSGVDAPGRLLGDSVRLRVYWSDIVMHALRQWYAPFD